MNQLKADNQSLREKNSMLKCRIDEIIANQYAATVNKTIREVAFDKESELRKELEKRLKTTQPALRGELLCQEPVHKASGSLPSQSTNANDSGSTSEITYLSGVTVSLFPVVFDMILLIRRLYRLER